MITYLDLLDPAGDLTPAMFPSDDEDALNARLSQYLTRAYAQVVDMTAGADQDAAAGAYAYYLAYRAIAAALAMQPSSASLEGVGSVGISGSQVKYFQDLATRTYQRYELLSATPADVIALPPSGPATNRPTW